LIARARREYVQPTYLAIAAFSIGLQDEALHHVRQAMDIRDASRHLLSKYFPYGRRLHADARFREPLLTMGYE